MASREETFTAKILVNDSEASSKLEKLKQQLADVKKRRDAALRDGEIDVWKAANKEVDRLTRSVEKQELLIHGLDHALRGMSTANQKELELLVKSINKELASGHVERNSKEWEHLNESLKKAKHELRLIREEGQEQPNIWTRFFKFLNESWGGLAIMFQSITGLSSTIRKSVQDYADMEEEMADVRKYTGLSAEQVKDLNEEFKRMDTRTSREELNQLAGAAGRLGITSKEGIKEFVEAADMIGVALGDDLGDGAVDKIGKLAMAFGEDENMGLKKAMLSTGSAINELAQNSSAKAGYLVDFTARVAGFGKQLGLTQAQIMGFGAMMDENLLRDEMAATAFGNMLTKMQTDTEKFARIAGMSLKDFSDLMQRDANAAVLALADSLRQADPQTMMKMLDAMGLDGSRAVGVLSTMADKIDDVRRHQQRATEAYKEATSVLGEFSTMNNTVQARLDKCKKQFQEMTVELGAKLLPVVNYTISSFSLMVKGISTVTSFVLENKAALLSAAAGIAAYTAYVNAATIATKAQTAATKIAEAATAAFNLVTKANPIGLLVAALSAAVVLFVKYRDRISGAAEATSMLRKAGAKLMEVMAQVVGWALNLVKAVAALYDKFAVVRKAVQLLGTAFTAVLATIANAAKAAIDIIGGVANVVEGFFTLDFNKAADGYKQAFKAIANAAVQQFGITKRAIKDIFSAAPPARGGKAPGSSATATTATAPTELPEVTITGKRRKTGDSVPVGFADEDEKARKKREAEEKRRLKQRAEAAKAEYQAQLAAEMEAYMKGATTYEQYLRSKHQLAVRHYDNLKRIYGEDSDEYKKLLDDRAREEQKYNEEQARLSEQALTMEHLDKERSIRLQYMRQEVQDEEAMNDALFRNDIEYMRKRQQLYENDPKRWAEMEMDIQQKQKDEQFRKEQAYMQRLSQFRQESGRMDYDKLEKIEREGAETFFSALVDQGQMTKEEYDAIIKHIERKYAGLKAEQAANGDISGKASQSLDTAKKAAGVKDVQAGDNAATGIFSISQAIENQRLVNEQLKQLYGEDYENNREYQEAKRQLDQETMQQIVAGAQAAYSTINTFMSAASSYAQACSNLEVAKITANYDKQIEAAGDNAKQKEKLEKKRDEEIRKAKTKANKKAMAIEIAQATASTAMAAINAYASAAKLPPPAGQVLPPIMAGVALAAGALQIATIKKQQQAQEAGYYEGGFTGGRRYRKEAGVVHEGEFVANHQAVQNPAVLPFLNFLDQAQRNNTVGSLTMQDVSRAMGTTTPQVVAPVVNVQTDNEELRGTLDGVRNGLDNLNLQLEDGIDVLFDMDRFEKNYRHYQNLKKRT